MISNSNVLFPYFKQVWDNKISILFVSFFFTCIGILIVKITPPRYETFVIIALEDSQKSNSKYNADLNYNAIQNNAYSYIFTSTPFLLDLLNITINNNPQKKLQDYLNKQLYHEKISHSYNDSQYYGHQYLKLTPIEYNNIEYLKNHIRISVSLTKPTLLIYSTFPSDTISAIVADSATKKLNQYISRYYNESKQKEYKNLLLQLKSQDSIYKANIKLYAYYKDKHKAMQSAIKKMVEDSLYNNMIESKNNYDDLYLKVADIQEDLYNIQQNFHVIEPAIIPKNKSNISSFKTIVCFFFLGIIFSTFWIIFIKPSFITAKQFITRINFNNYGNKGQ
jgi:LPS O-antigen subunit length determinant protein (WzzB/FepE family)